MVTAKISIELREEFGLTAASTQFPEATFHYLTGIVEQGVGLGLVEVVGDDLDDVLASVETSDAVSQFELLDRYENRAVFQYETEVARLYRAVREAGILPAFPYVIRDGTILFETTTSADRLSRLGDRLRSLEFPFEVTSVTRAVDGTDVLTDRQQRFVLAAVERGYYDTPRRCTLTDLAESFGIASSTASELLHRAEGQIVTEFAARLDPAADRVGN